jgi:hypothetical protein
MLEPAGNSRLWQIYHGIKQRCYQVNDKDYHRYRQRGILMCPEWKHSYVAFRKWALENGYAAPLTIDRKDPTKGYSPDNCQWITRFENETKHAKPITAFGETKFIWEWEKDIRLQVSKKTLRSRLHQGWLTERAITTPKRRYIKTTEITQELL